MILKTAINRQKLSLTQIFCGLIHLELANTLNEIVLTKKKFNFAFLLEANEVSFSWQQMHQVAQRGVLK